MRVQGDVKPQLLIVDNDIHTLFRVRSLLGKKYPGITTDTSPYKIRRHLKDRSYDVILLSLHFASSDASARDGLNCLKKIAELSPESKVILMIEQCDPEMVNAVMRQGAYGVIEKPIDPHKLVKLVTDAIEKVKSSVEEKPVNGPEEDEFITGSQSMVELLNTVRRIAPTQANVLLLGENGTGKDLVARHIHKHSLRKSNPFVAVDLGAIPESLFESELFGYKKGAFTDARSSRTGRVLSADTGTLFLDEIGNLPLHMQAKLLFTIQTKSVVPLGSDSSVNVNARLIAATNIDIQKMVASGDFRPDLYYRINTIELKIPPLRERPDDIPLLTKYYLEKFSAEHNKKAIRPGKEATQHLLRYHWPGNVRQLKHVIERAVILNENGFIYPADLNLGPVEAITLATVAPASVTMREMEIMTIKQAILDNSGNLTQTARQLKVGRATLYRKISKYGI